MDTTAENLRELWRFRDLLRQLVRRELKVRYKNSVLGFVWSIFPPLLQVFVYTFFMRVALTNKAISPGPYILCAMIPWTFINATLLDSSQSLLLYFPIIKKIYLPREVIPLAVVVSNTIHFLLGWAVFFAVYLIVFPLLHLTGLPALDKLVGIPLLPTMVWFPVITIVCVLFVSGMSLWAAALNVFYNDVKFILQTCFNLLLLLLPVFYPADVIANKAGVHSLLFKLYMLNPITAIIEGYRKTLLQPIARESFNLPKTFNPLYMDWSSFIGATVISVLIAWSGYRYFNLTKWRFVERP